MAVDGDQNVGRGSIWRRRGFIRALILLAASALVAALVSSFGLARQYGYLRASLLSGPTTGVYYTLATRLALRAKADHGQLTAVSTAGSIDNVDRLVKDDAGCDQKFALVQDGTPMPADRGLELLGRLPEPESLILLTRQGNTIGNFENLRNKSIGIGPEGSGTAFLMRLMFGDPDLADLNIKMPFGDLDAQAQAVSEGRIDLAAYVIRSDAEFLRTIIRKYNLEIVALKDLPGLVARHRWLALGRIPSGRYGLLPPIPETDRPVPQINTLIIASHCAKRADRIAFLTLVGAEIPDFVKSNPPASTSFAEQVPLANEARQFFSTGGPEFADKYFPWAVNLMSPAYWVYFLMAATALFNGLRGLSRFRLWRIDAAREKIVSEIRNDLGPGAHPDFVGKGLSDDHRANLVRRLIALRMRCHRYVSSFVTPMGDEMFYRYQQSLIDEAVAALAS